MVRISASSRTPPSDRRMNFAVHGARDRFGERRLADARGPEKVRMVAFGLTSAPGTGMRSLISRAR